METYNPGINTQDINSQMPSPVSVGQVNPITPLAPQPPTNPNWAGSNNSVANVFGNAIPNSYDRSMGMPQGAPIMPPTGVSTQNTITPNYDLTT